MDSNMNIISVWESKIETKSKILIFIFDWRIINIRKTIKVHLAYLANKKLLFRLDNGYIEEFSVPTSCIYSISRYKILEDNSTRYRRTIKDVENVIKVINILTDWLNGEEILYINDEYKTTKILESVPLISTLTANQYKTFKI